jgi:hypothetical protein
MRKILRTLRSQNVICWFEVVRWEWLGLEGGTTKEGLKETELNILE